MARFSVFSSWPNLVLIFVIFLSFFGFSYFWGKKNKGGEWGRTFYEFGPAIIGGFFWDIFSDCFLGFHVLILLAIVISIRFVFKNYIRLPAAYG
ncbi:MAG: hypothetical protein ABH919_00715 [bacterium]